MSAEQGPSRDVSIPARDGFQLAATLFGDAASRVIIVSSATGVPRRFYRHYATALSNAGYCVITYDYRGIGASRPDSLRGFEARTRDWGLLDMAGVVDWAASELNAEWIFKVGHSVGGQVTGLIDNSDKISGMVTVSAQSGHWRLQGGEQKWLAAIHVHLTLPLLANVVGYMPWSWWSGAEDLPKGAALEWSRWCRNRRYLFGDKSLPLERFDSFAAPVLAYSIEGDKWGTQPAVEAMMSAYPNLQRRHIVPHERGLPELGHFGLFRPFARPLWDEHIEWFDAIN